MAQPARDPTLIKRFEHPPRRAAVDRLRGASPHPRARVAHLAGDLERQRRAQQQAIPVRAAVLAAPTPPAAPRIVLRIAACEVAGRAGLRSRSRPASRISHGPLRPGRTSNTVNGPIGVGSSQPSAPWTTNVRSNSHAGERLGNELRHVAD